MSSLWFLLLFAAQCTLSFGISIDGSSQIIYNTVDPMREPVKLVCLNSNGEIIQGVNWTRNNEQVSDLNPLILLDSETLGEDPLLHEGRYRCIYNNERSREVTVYGKLRVTFQCQCLPLFIHSFAHPYRPEYK